MNDTMHGAYIGMSFYPCRMDVGHIWCTIFYLTLRLTIKLEFR